MSPILPNMSTGNALNLPILSSAPMCLGRSGQPRSSFFGVLGLGRCRPSHTAGTVAEEIDSSKHELAFDPLNVI